MGSQPGDRLQELESELTRLTQENAALKNQDADFRLLFEAGLDALFLIDNQTGQILLANKAASDMYGYSPEELLTLKNTQLSAEPEQTRQVTEGSPPLLDQVIIIPLRWHRKKDGSRFPVEISGRFFIRHERPVHIASIRDISRRLQNEKDLMLAFHYWQATFNASSDAIFVLDAKHRILRANSAVKSIFDVSDGEIVGKHCWEIIHGTTEPIADCPVLRVRESLKRESMVLNVGDVWFEITVDPLLDDQGQYCGAVHIVSDITLRKWSEAELLRGRDRLECLNRILQFQANSVQTLLDYSLSETIRITGSKVGYIYYYSEEKQEFTLNSWSKEVMNECRVANPASLYHLEKTGIWGEVVRQRQAIIVNDFDQQNPLKKGYPQGHIPLKRFLTVPVFQDQNIVAVVGVANKEQAYDDTDVLQLSLLMDAVWKIADRRVAAEEKLQLEAQFRQVQKLESIGRLAGGVAHDFNNMLCIILGYGEGLKRGLPLGSRLYKDAHEIVEAAKRSAALTRQLLAFSRRQAMQSKVLDLNVLLGDVEKMLRRLIGEDIVLEMNFAETIAPVLADPGQIEQVIMNLAVNARDAMPQGGRLVFETENVDLDEAYAMAHQGVVPGRYVRLAVTDTGYGMTPDVLSHVFEPFFTTKGAGQGTGLGLATVYGIVKQSGGNIWIYSEQGKGTSVKVYLPVSSNQVVKQEEEKVHAHKTGRGQQVLVVDDELSLQMLVERILTDLGYEVSKAGSGAEALRMVHVMGLKPDLLISDVIMPGMNGPDLFERLLSILPDLKVLFMSGYTNITIEDKGGLVKGAPFIQKPFNTRDFLIELDEILRDES